MAFYLVFGLFVAAFLFLAFWTIRWAIRRDIKSRAEWMSHDESDEQHPHGS